MSNSFVTHFVLKEEGMEWVWYIIAVYVYLFSKSCELTNKKRCVSSSTREFNFAIQKAYHSAIYLATFDIFSAFYSRSKVSSRYIFNIPCKRTKAGFLGRC